MPSVIGVIQGRMGSSRLPGKLLAPLAGRPLLGVLVERLRTAHVDEWWLATTDQPEDDVSAAWGRALGLEVYRGDADDVLSRFAAIVRARDPEWVVRVTADDPFVDAAIVNRLVAAAREADAEVEHLGEPTDRRLPLGYVPEIVRGRSIMAADRDEARGYRRAHVTTSMRESGRSRPIAVPPDWPKRPAWRWTVDTADDLAMADAAFRAFGSSWATVDYPSMVRIVDGRPEIAARNAAVRQKAAVEG